MDRLMSETLRWQQSPPSSTFSRRIFAEGGGYQKSLNEGKIMVWAVSRHQIKGQNKKIYMHLQHEYPASEHAFQVGGRFPFSHKYNLKKKAVSNERQNQKFGKAYNNYPILKQPRVLNSEALSQHQRCTGRFRLEVDNLNMKRELP